MPESVLQHPRQLADDGVWWVGEVVVSWDQVRCIEYRKDTESGTGVCTAIP